MKFAVEVSLRAKQDIFRIVEYIDRVLQNSKAADEWLEELNRVVSSLERFPKRHKICDEDILHVWGIRCVAVRNYLLFYVVHDNKVEIVRVLYKKANWINLLSCD